MATDNTPAKKQKTEMQEYSLTSANSILSMANELAKFIKDRKLTQNIKGKEFVLVEAWTFAGMSMGLMPVPVKVTNISTDSEIKYEAVVELLNIHTNQVVGRGFAICSNKEAGKKYFEEYAIASMAQTRATSKAYRLPLGFLMKAAGYEATPAEEMDFANHEVMESNKPDPVKKAAAEAAMTASKSEPPKPATTEQQEIYKELLQEECWKDDEREAALMKLPDLNSIQIEKAIAAMRKAIEMRAVKAA